MTPAETATRPADARGTTAERVLEAACAYARANTEAAIRDAVLVGAAMVRDDGTESRMVRVETAAGTLMFLKVYVTPDGGLQVKHYRV